jgi:hypothetical protein
MPKKKKDWWVETICGETIEAEEEDEAIEIFTKRFDKGLVTDCNAEARLADAV